MGNCLVCCVPQRFSPLFYCDRCTGKRSSGDCDGIRNGTCCCNPKGLPSPLCVYYSSRIEDLLQGRKTEEETDKVHWTIPHPSHPTAHVVDPTESDADEQIAEENRKYFEEVLVRHPTWGPFFTKFDDLEVGDKIGEGGQAEIFKATSPSFKFVNPRYPDSPYQPSLAAKVWKMDVPLKDLERLWPPAMLIQVAQGSMSYPFKNILGGTFIRDGEFKNRFAFVMRRYPGDLRTFIDGEMIQLLCKNSHGPPLSQMEYAERRLILTARGDYTDDDTLQSAYEDLLRTLCHNLVAMHEVGVLHRDIKASNVVLFGLINEIFRNTALIDYECSMNVSGTGFWRAPEILRQVEQVQKGEISIHDVVFTDKADIYSFGMLCYEIVTGLTPFEDKSKSDYSIVLNGERPKLPNDLYPWLKDIILDCWQDDPQLRPSASDIESRLPPMQCGIMTMHPIAERWLEEYHELNGSKYIGITEFVEAYLS